VSTDNLEIVRRFWQTMYARDWDGVKEYFAPEGEYTDVPSPADDVARGPDAIAARLELGLGPLEAIIHHPARDAADGNIVMTEHAEEWHWPTGEQVVLPFLSVHELRDGLIVRWWDYWDMNTLMGAAPQWWIEHIMQGYQ
jgi:limonene-1,2-epoxide hydrolase